MSDNSIDLGGEGQSFAFDEIGDRVVGKVVGFEQMQQTDMETNEPKFWPGGQPMTMIRVDLKTKLREDNTDDGIRSIYLRGSKKASSKSSMAAVLSAMKEATGSTKLDVGAILSLEFVDEDKPKRRGHNGRKLYEAVYKPPTLRLADDGDEDDERPARKSKALSASSASVNDDFDDEPAPRTRRRQAEPEDDEPAPRKRSRPADDDDFDDEPALRTRRRAPIDEPEDEPAPRTRRRQAEPEDEDERPARRTRRRAPIDDDFDEDDLRV